ncbi:unnamed protein product [Camellia sinensis]
MEEQEKSIQEELSLPILLADRVIKSAQEAESSLADCAELAKQAHKLSHQLRCAARLAAAASSLYDRPLRRIAADVSKNLDRALTLVRKCKHGGGVLRHVFAITTTADHRKVSSLLDSSSADVAWLLSIFDFDSDGGGANLSLPPIASNDPTLAFVWTYIAAVQMNHHHRGRIDAANNLASLARDNDLKKKIIVEEGGVPPLLKLLKERASPESQIVAAGALLSVGNDPRRVKLIAREHAAAVILQVLGDSPIKVQIAVANLVAKMAEMDSDVQEEFGKENVIRPLVMLLCVDIELDDTKLQAGSTSIHSLVQINKELSRSPLLNHTLHTDSNSSSSTTLHKKDKGIESPELKLDLRISCANALWKLSKGCLLNSRKITETKGLLCLAKLIEKEKEELQINCLMAVMELAAVAESNTELRRLAFKPSSPAAKAVLEQLLRVMNESTSPTLLIPAINSIGSLAHTFTMKETRIIGPLVTQLGHRNSNVGTEAAIALGKFVCPDNFNRVENSKAIINSDGIPKLMNLLKANGRDQVHELVLLCYLALNIDKDKGLEHARVLNVLEGAARSVLPRHPELRELFAMAIHHLTLYQAGVHIHIPAHALLLCLTWGLFYLHSIVLVNCVMALPHNCVTTSILMSMQWIKSIFRSVWMAIFGWFVIRDVRGTRNKHLKILNFIICRLTTDGEG